MPCPKQTGVCTSDAAWLSLRPLYALGDRFLAQVHPNPNRPSQENLGVLGVLLTRGEGFEVSGDRLEELAEAKVVLREGVGERIGGH